MAVEKRGSLQILDPSLQIMSQAVHAGLDEDEKHPETVASYNFVNNRIIQL